MDELSQLPLLCVLGSAPSCVSGDHHAKLYRIQCCFPSWLLWTQDCDTWAGTGCSALTAVKILSSNALPYLTQAVLFNCGGEKWMLEVKKHTG